MTKQIRLKGWKKVDVKEQTLERLEKWKGMYSGWDETINAVIDDLEIYTRELSRIRNSEEGAWWMSQATFSRKETIGLYLVYAFVVTLVTVAAIGMLLMTTDVFGSGAKGLKVYLTVNTNLAGQPVEIYTSQFGENVEIHDSYMDNGYTEFELLYDRGMVVNGEFKICVYAVNADIEECTYGYDSEAKKPEYVSVDLFGSNMPSQPQPVEQPPQQDQSQSQSSNNENNNANSQSQTTNIYICNDGECKKQWQ